MTKLKNTKKGMAKKALSVSLVAAMLATSNVPVWAAEDLFSAGETGSAIENLFDDSMSEQSETAVNLGAAITTDKMDFNTLHVASNTTSTEWGKTVSVTLTGYIDKDNSNDTVDYLQSFNYVFVDEDGSILTEEAKMEGLESKTSTKEITLELKNEWAGKTLSLRVYRNDKDAQFIHTYSNLITIEKKDFDQLFFEVNGVTVGTTASASVNVPYADLDSLVIKGAKEGIATKNSLEKDVDYTISLNGTPDATGNQTATIKMSTFTYNKGSEYDFNVTDIKGSLDNTLATVTTESGSVWDGQWGTIVKANLDTSYGKVISYEWQKCKTADDQTIDANWTAVQNGNNQTYETNQYLVKNGGEGADDYSLRVKIVYQKDNEKEKTTYSEPIAVKPKKVNAENIEVTLGSGSSMKEQLDNATIKVKDGTTTVTLPKAAYEYQGFDEDYVGDQQIAFVLTSPYEGKVQMTVNAKAVSIANATITANPIDYVYNPEGFIPELTVKLADVTLTEGKDYEIVKVTSNVTEKVTQSDINGAPNGATVTIKGKDKYTGIATTKVNILPADLTATCEIAAKKTTKKVGTKVDENNFAEYFDVYYKTSDGRKIKLEANNNFKIIDNDANNAAGLTNTITVKGLATNKNNWDAGQNFYGSLSIQLTTVAENDIFDDASTIEGSSVTKGAAFLGEIASAITGDVYMVNGQTTTKVALDTTPGEGVTYTGSSITFSGLNSLKHYVDTESGNKDGIETLKINQDYTVTYNNNTNAGTYINNPAPSVTIKMIGKYEGERTFYFNIEQKEISDIGNATGQINNTTSTIVFNPLVTNATAKTDYSPLEKLSLTYNGAELIEGKDYEDVWVKWVNEDEDDTSKGHFVYTLKAHQSRDNNDGSYYDDGNYTGKIDDETTLTKAISAKSLTSDDIVFEDIDNQEWTGQAVKPTLKITDQGGKYTLIEGVDYTTEWTNNVKTGTATVTVEGIANRYKDKLQKTFTITSKSLNDGMIVNAYKATTSNDLSDYTSADQVLLNQMYNDGKEVSAEFVVVDANNNRLVENRDYTVSYTNNINVGTATITITGAGSYEGTLTSTFKIVGQLINGKFDKTVIADQVYTGEEIKPEVNFTVEPSKLVEGQDYEIAYVNNINCFTATGKEDLNAADYAGPYVVARGIGNYAGQIRLAFNIVKADLTSANVTVSDAEYAGGKVAIPTLTVKNPVSGKELVEGTDYTVSYKGGVNVGDKGEATITLKNTDNYTINGSVANTLTVGYEVVPKDLENVTVEEIADQTATGSQITPAVTAINNDVILTPNVDYTVIYGENTEVGVGTITLTAAGKNYTGTKEITFNIVEAEAEVGQAVISNIRVSGNTVTPVLSGDVDGAVGYDYVISTSDDVTDTASRIDVSKNILNTNTNFYYVETGTYYVYCHAWMRDENGLKVFGDWSNVVPVEVTAVTPERPMIQSAKLKGNTLTVTWSRSADATGYDIVMGKAARKVNGEMRPVDYGKAVKKITNGDTVTVTFRNIPKGTYYVGLHAWNRTSESGVKVFSPWSNGRKVVVK